MAVVDRAQADAHQMLCISIKDSFDRNTSSIRDVLEENRISLCDELKKHNLTVYLKDISKAYDTIRDQVLVSFELTNDVDELELRCQHFLTSLLKLDKKSAINLSRKLRKDWNREAIKLGFSSFLSKETLKKEEVQLIRSAIGDNDPLMACGTPVKRQHSASDQHYEVSSRHCGYYLKKINKENEPAKALEEQFNSIVDIISRSRARESIFFDVACRLCEARLLPAAIKDQAFKIKNFTIQVKCVMESVYTMVQRGVRPKILLENFIFVLNFPEIRGQFRHVVNKFGKQDYLPNPTRNVRKHTKCAKQIVPECAISSVYAVCNYSEERGLEDPSDHQLRATNDSRTAPVDLDDYQCQLKRRYGRVVSFLGRIRRYFDVSTNEKSVTKKSPQQPGGGSILDLACIPQQDNPQMAFPPRTLILGAPGVGKSSVVNELCRLWSEGHLLKAYQYVIRLRANDPRVRTAKTLKDLVPQNAYDSICQSYGRNCLFILDGYEDFCEDEEIKENGFYDRLIRGEDLPDELFEAALIVTTRPWCAKQIMKYFPSEVEILGFTPDIREQYVRYRLDKEADIESFLSQPPVMAQCTSNPLLLTTLLEIFIEHKEMPNVLAEQSWPKTLTSLYGFLIRLLVLRFVRKHKSLSKHLPHAISILTGEFSKLPHRIYEYFLKVCSIAYQNMSTRFLPSDFDHDDLVTFELINGPETIEYCDGQQVVYEFLHSSICEYLAAYFISRMDEEEMEKRIKCLQSASFKYQLVIEFLYGFGCINKIDPKCHDNYKIVNNFNILRQLCEAQSSHELIKSVYDGFSNETCIIRRTFPTPLPFDFWCLGRVIALSGCEWELGFTLRSIRDEHIKSLREGLNSVDTPTGVIRKLGFSLTMIQDEGVSQICQMNELHQVTEIFLSANHFTSSIISPLYRSIRQGKFRNLSTFLLHLNNIEPGQHHDLILTLKDCRSLEHDECRMLCS